MELAGRLLIAMPDLLDPNFYRSVVLVLEHDADGTLGLVLNRKSALTLQELCINQGLIWRGDDGSVRLGGPVQPTSLWVLYGGQSEHSDFTTINDGCILTTTMEGLTEVCNDADADRILFAGYAGWGEGQLEQELREGAWLSAPAAKHLVFAKGVKNMWADALRHVGVDPGALVASRSGTLQ